MFRTDIVFERFGTGDVTVSFAWIADDLIPVLGIGVLMVLGVLFVRDRFGLRETSTIESAHRQTEIVSDQKRVYRLLQENGGQMKQSEIVDTVDWSKAKVSRLLSDLEDDGEITKISVGRENLICLPGHEPTETTS
ncbi:winged helix-turn-helix transcriptional regulator [Haloterrigena salinisoli]|uniref:helix-turn-helix transcriptional regulator n=1 Tax=Haloterrigena salinisoli TaxID=3132747 RepID=UPI0030CDDA4E